MLFKINILLHYNTLRESYDTLHYPRTFQGGEESFKHQLTKLFFFFFNYWISQLPRARQIK